MFALLMVACASEDFTATDPQINKEETQNELMEEEENELLKEEENEQVKDDCPIDHIKSEIQEPLSRRWKLVGILDDGEDGLTYPPCVGYRVYQPGFHYPFMIHLELMDTSYPSENDSCLDCLSFLGFAGVNQIFGFYQFDEDDGSFTIRAGMTFAGNHIHLRNFEKRYLKNLMSTSSYSLDGNELHLYYEGGKMLYTPTDEVPTGVYDL